MKKKTFPVAFLTTLGQSMTGVPTHRSLPPATPSKRKAANAYMDSRLVTMKTAPASQAGVPARMCSAYVKVDAASPHMFSAVILSRPDPTTAAMHW